MNMKLGPGELLAGPWQLTPIRDLVRLADRAPKWRVTICASPCNVDGGTCLPKGDGNPFSGSPGAPVTTVIIAQCPFPPPKSVVSIFCAIISISYISCIF